MGRGKHKKRNAIERHGNDPKQQQQAASVKVMRTSSLAPDKSSETFTSNPSSFTRHHHPGKKGKKKRKVKYAEQMREQKMLDIQASKYAYVGIMRQLESPDDRAEEVRDGSISAVKSTRNSEHSGDEYSDDSYCSESAPRGQVRAARASRQLATVELFPSDSYDKDLQLGQDVGDLGTTANRDHSRHLGLATVEFPFEIDMPSPIISRNRRAIAVSDYTYHNDAVKNEGLFQPEKQVGLSEIELPLPPLPILHSPAKLIGRKHSTVSENAVRLDFSNQFDSFPKSKLALHGLPWSQQGQIQLFKELQSKQLGLGEVEIEIPISECDAGSEVDISVNTSTQDICPTAFRRTAIESSNFQLHKTEVELPELVKMEDITTEKKKPKNKENYSVMINEGIKMIRIASSPHREERSIQDRAECKAGPTRATTEVGHGQGFVTLDDLPEFGCDPSALARPATSHAQASSGKSIVLSTPPRRKTIKRPKSKPGLDIILAVVNGMPFYTRNTYFKSPIYDTWACLSIADVHALKQIPATQTYGDHFWKNHPIKYICILGICVGVTIRETNAIVKVDDGSGREIECITKEQTRFGFVESMDPGSLVRVLGTLGYYRKAKQLEIKSIAIIRDSYAEVEFWEQMLATRDIIDEMWMLRECDFSVDDRKRLSRNLSVS
ncbi:telomere regulation protein Stn1-domain-containing protein [Lipomyces mesembrius]